MKLGIIMQPESGCFERAKELGLDFVEFDCNPVEYFGRPVEELWNSRETLKEESRRTGVEVGAVGRWASLQRSLCGRTLLLPEHYRRH